MYLANETLWRIMRGLEVVHPPLEVVVFLVSLLAVDQLPLSVLPAHAMLWEEVPGIEVEVLIFFSLHFSLFHLTGDWAC